MNYYKAIATGKIVSEYKIKIADDIFGVKIVAGAVEKVDNPSVVDCLKAGSFSTAVERYREINGCSRKEALNATKVIQGQMTRFRKEYLRKKFENDTEIFA